MRSKGPGDPKYALLHRINTARRNRERIESADMLSLIRAYNADYTGKKTRRIQVFAHGSAIYCPPPNQPNCLSVAPKVHSHLHNSDYGGPHDR
jgi:hypothetical protein